MAIWFNARDYDPSQTIGQLPVGNGMPAIIVSGARQAVKDRPQDGMLVLTAQIIDGPNKGAQGAMRYNLWNSASPQNAEIAHRQLSALAHCIGVYDLQDETAAELFNKPFLIDVAKQTNNPEYTQVVAVYDIYGKQPSRQAAVAPPANPAQQPPQQPPGWNAPGGNGQPNPGWTAPNNAPPAQPGPTYQPANAPAPSWAQQPSGATSSNMSTWGRG